MNEGWASHWHHRIMNALDLPPECGSSSWSAITRSSARIRAGSIRTMSVSWSGATSRSALAVNTVRRVGTSCSKSARVERDVSFLRRFLTEELCRELDLFTWRPRGEHLVVSEVADEEHWDDVKGALLKQIGTGSMPCIRIQDANYKGRRGFIWCMTMTVATWT